MRRESFPQPEENLCFMRIPRCQDEKLPLQPQGSYQKEHWNRKNAILKERSQESKEPIQRGQGSQASCSLIIIFRNYYIKELIVEQRCGYHSFWLISLSLRKIGRGCSMLRRSPLFKLRYSLLKRWSLFYFRLLLLSLAQVFEEVYCVFIAHVWGIWLPYIVFLRRLHKLVKILNHKPVSCNLFLRLWLRRTPLLECSWWCNRFITVSE
jgi:hypothetical protein